MTSSDDFFKAPAPRSRPQELEVMRMPEWFGPSHGSLPAVVSLELALAATDDVTVYVAGADVYPHGFVFHFRTVSRDPEIEPEPLSYRFGHGSGGEIPPEMLRLGILFADGSKATNTGGKEDDYWEEDGPRPRHPLMRASGGGGGGNGDWDQLYWIWPLPPEGPMELICEWPAQEIPLTRTEVDSQPFRDAAARARSPFES